MFDQAARHLLTQGSKAEDSYICKYRRELNDGTILKCAVGCFIADYEYKPIIEGELYGYKYFNEFLGFEGKAPHFSLLRRLQRLHDNYPVSMWKEDLEKIAEDFNLNADILKEFN